MRSPAHSSKSNGSNDLWGQDSGGLSRTWDKLAVRLKARVKDRCIWAIFTGTKGGTTDKPGCQSHPNHLSLGWAWGRRDFLLPPGGGGSAEHQREAHPVPRTPSPKHPAVPICANSSAGELVNHIWCLHLPPGDFLGGFFEGFLFGLWRFLIWVLEVSYLGFQTEWPSCEDKPSVQGYLPSTPGFQKGGSSYRNHTKRVYESRETVVAPRSAAFSICPRTGVVKIKTQKTSLKEHWFPRCQAAEMKRLKVHLLAYLAIWNHRRHCFNWRP